MTTATGGFEALLGELETLAKAIPSDDDAGDASDAGDAAGNAADDPNDEGKSTDAGKDEGGGDPTMTKSFKLKLEDGTEVEAEDGTALVKALTDRLDANESSMLKALTTAVTLLKAQGKKLDEQGALIKSQQEQIDKLGDAGRGRKSTVTVLAKGNATTAAANANEGVTPGEFLAKAQSAMDSGKISGGDLALIETYLNRSAQVPEYLAAKVLA